MCRSGCAGDGCTYVGERASRAEQNTSGAIEETSVAVGQRRVEAVGSTHRVGRGDRHTVRTASNGPPPTVGVRVTSVLDKDGSVSRHRKRTNNRHGAA